MKGLVLTVILVLWVSISIAQRFHSDRRALSEHSFTHKGTTHSFDRPGVGNGTGPGGGNGGGNGNGNGSGGGGNLPPVPINSGMWMLVLASSAYYFRVIRKSILKNNT